MYFKGFLCFLFTCVHTNGLIVTEPNPPKPNPSALMARYIMHSVGWATISSISTMPEIKSFPYANLEEMVDGLDDKGNGVPYFYVAVYDPLTIDTEQDNRCTLVASLAESSWCKEKNFEEEDPRCARVMISGRFVRVSNTTEEHNSALNHMHRKHPQSNYWPTSHHFYIGKIDIQHINLFDSFGGIKTINVKEYLNANEEFDNNI
ncbi:hypothetical protein RN001_004682 [Aquatica leii]|uniref:CREG-like beta-barrel domain-containing protein n=1 Tax=Aquatica leii TaxID=1421715 RepID=A0AAN7PBY6_9COLE|nr:hypothetical protein RN001_004682 [Aquatica leii]